MPEGPSIVIAVEELAKLKNKVVVDVYGNTKTDKERLLGKKILDIFSYGKYLNFQFKDFAMRIHFMLFGSYRVNDQRADREPRLTIAVKGNYANFYSSSIKFFETKNIRAEYNFATDIMSPLWDKKIVINKIKQLRNETLDDILMDQEIFTGVGNIIKNEVLFRQRLLPSTKVGDISSQKLSKFVDEARAYSLLFYELKKKYILKKSYQIYRKSSCPICGGKVTHMKTGKKQRMSHFCSRQASVNHSAKHTD
jgi:endonuclease VIII